MKSRKYMNSMDIEKRLRRAAKDMGPKGGRSAAEKLWEISVEKADGTEWFLDGTAGGGDFSSEKGGLSRLFPGISRRAVSLAACMAAVLAVFYHTTVSTYATVYLDINPSFSIGINRWEKVIEAAADNAEGAEILKDLQLDNMEIGKAIALICEAAADQGYIKDKDNAVLLSVGGAAGTGGLRSRLSEEVERTMKEAAAAGTVYEQDLDETDLDEADEDMAEMYGMTPAKAHLLEILVRDHPELAYEELAGLSVSELQHRLKSGGSDLRDYTLWHGTDPDEYYDVTDDHPEAEESDEDDTDRWIRADRKDDPDHASADGDHEADGHDEEHGKDNDDADEEDEDRDDDEQEKTVSRSEGIGNVGRTRQPEAAVSGSGHEAVRDNDQDDSGDDAYENKSPDSEDGTGDDDDDDDPGEYGPGISGTAGHDTGGIDTGDDGSDDGDSGDDTSDDDDSGDDGSDDDDSGDDGSDDDDSGDDGSDDDDSDDD